MTGEELLFVSGREQVRDVGCELRQLGALALNSLEETDVLDRDHREVGERLDQPDLHGVERPHLVAGDRDRADRHAFPHHRDPERGAVAREPLQVG